MDDAVREQMLVFQKNEITEYHIYRKLATLIKDPNNSQVLQRIADEEKKHYDILREHTGTEVKPDRFRIWYYITISRVLGLTFGVKLMEKGEENAQEAYDSITESFPEARDIKEDENEHERELLSLLDEERLKYVGSIVLGLNDALVELIGALAGLTFALQDTRLVATAGLVTGIAASLSMAASEYLSTRSEPSDKNPVKAATYTGFAYIFAVALLILPFLVLGHLYLCLGVSLIMAVLIIFIFTFYVSVAQEVSFKKRFLEMITISMGVALVSFLIGLIVRMGLGIE
ncbi:MAG: rubrerythrin family protein [Candidatus Omnitrophica bacterium]|nr:rubrerythrin family protein [Candidatus Omnitrophota bacterium]